VKFTGKLWETFHSNPSSMPDADLRLLMLDLRSKTLSINHDLRHIERDVSPQDLPRVRQLDGALAECEMAAAAIISVLESRRKKAG
jgi:hypothetical protein